MQFFGSNAGPAWSVCSIAAGGIEDFVGATVGAVVGAAVGAVVGAAVGAVVGCGSPGVSSVGVLAAVGAVVGAADGSGAASGSHCSHMAQVVP